MTSGSEIRSIISDLERRFRLINEIKGKEEGEFLFFSERINEYIRATKLDTPLFFGALRDYIEVTRKALRTSDKFHMFNHEEHDRFEEEVCKRIMNDKTILPENRDSRVIDMFEIYFAPTYDTLCNITDKIEKTNDVRKIISSLKFSGETYLEYLKRIHPTIISVLEEELVEVPTESIAVNYKDGVLSSGKEKYTMRSEKVRKLFDVLWKHQNESFPKDALAVQVGLIDSPREYPQVKEVFEQQIKDFNRTFAKKHLPLQIVGGEKIQLIHKK